MTARHVIFSGRVQGVGFRFTTLDVANRYQLTGFVRNCADGTVEMVAQGPNGRIKDCVRDIQARYTDYITQTKIEEIPPNSQLEDFKITF